MGRCHAVLLATPANNNGRHLRLMWTTAGGRPAP